MLLLFFYQLQSKNLFGVSDNKGTSFILNKVKQIKKDAGKSVLKCSFLLSLPSIVTWDRL